MNKEIPLGKEWKLKHFSDEERNYLGRLVLTPQKPRKDFDNLSLKEQRTLGICLKLINQALKCYWSTNTEFSDDPLERVYVIYFNETKPPCLHIHLFPRTKKMGGCDPMKCAAWNIVHLLDCGMYPDNYKIDESHDPNKKRVEYLMDYLEKYMTQRISHK